jgi:hypothetical protein
MLIIGVTAALAMNDILTYFWKPFLSNAGMATKVVRPIKMYPNASKFQNKVADYCRSARRVKLIRLG